jgi:GNAT superfamily N-acetyltransferase
MKESAANHIAIRVLDHGESNVLYALVDKLGHNKDLAYFGRCFERVGEGTLAVLIAAYQGVDAGYCLLNWEPKYGLFKTLGLPEIQDLNVLRELRKKGIGTALIKHCENLAREKSFESMGIGVGLHSSYGAAQKLYMKMGYVPDGNGITYDRQQLAFGDLRPNDDLLCLMMIKTL